MHIRHFTVVTVLAAMGALAGCGPEDGGNPDDRGDAAYRQSGDQVPAPESSVSGRETGSDPGVQGSERMSETAGPAAEPGIRQGTGQGIAGETDQTDQPIGMTEFAALDTDADGKLAENEWDASAVQGLEFSDIDEDSSGDIDREEFRQAVSMSGSESGATGAEDMSGSDPSQSGEDPTAP